MKDACLPDIAQAIEDYLLWMIESGYSQFTVYNYQRILKHFVVFIGTRKIPQDAVFTFDTLKAFEKEHGLCLSSNAVKGLARYLYRQNRLTAPITRLAQKLPDIYEQYLNTRQVGHNMLHRIRGVLSALNRYLQKENVALSELKIEHIDGFLKAYNAPYSATSRAHNRSCLRTFLRYLCHERNILRKDLALLLTAAPLYA